jgi:hypothetical protein
LSGQCPSGVCSLYWEKSGDCQSLVKRGRERGQVRCSRREIEEEGRFISHSFLSFPCRERTQSFSISFLKGREREKASDREKEGERKREEGERKKREIEREKEREGDRQRGRETREKELERERMKEREREREREKERERERTRESAAGF